MARYDRARWRAAELVRDQLHRRRQFQLGAWVQAGTTPLSAFDRHAHLQRRLQCAQRRELPVAADRLRQQMVSVLRDLRVTLEGVVTPLSHPLPPLPTMRELVEELDALEGEFGQLTVDLSARRLAVQTEAIELEEVYLGPFALELELTELGQPGSALPLFVVAQDPQPAAGDSHVTHPHVSDERLCAGEGHAALQAMLAQGRLCEFFLLVRSVLSTYNRDSPYVPLESWSGEPCHDCDTRVDDDERSACQQCDRTFCDECIVRCPHCEDAICHGCMSRCDRCQEPVCDGCLERCASCRQFICPGCREDAVCERCHEQANEADLVDEPESDAAAPSPPPPPATAAGGTGPMPPCDMEHHHPLH